MNLQIPLVAHFVYGLWDDTPMPKWFERTMGLWEANGWTIRLWTPLECEALIQKYEQYKNMWQRFPRKIQRADFIRYLIVFDEGGFYFDLDCIPGWRSLKMEIETKNPTSVFFIEHYSSLVDKIAKIHPIRKGLPEHPERLANFAFGAIAHHDALLAIINTVSQRFHAYPMIYGDPDYYVLYTTGPSALTRAIQNKRQEEEKNDIAIMKVAPWLQHLQTGTWRKSLGFNG